MLNALKDLKDYYKFKKLARDIEQRAASNKTYRTLHPYLVIKPKLRTLRLQTDSIHPHAIEIPIDNIDDTDPNEVARFLKTLFDEWSRIVERKTERDKYTDEHNRAANSRAGLLWRLVCEIKEHYSKKPKWMSPERWGDITLITDHL